MASQNIDPSLQSRRTSTKKADGSGGTSKDKHSVTKRLQKELSVLMLSNDKDISACPNGENLFKWIGTINGAKGTVYENLSYKLSLEFPSNYPYTAPTVKFDTPIFHPNVDHHGNICLDILKEEWSASYDVKSILLSIQSLLGEPNNDSPLNGYAAELWENQTMYKQVLVEKYKKEVNADVKV